MQISYKKATLHDIAPMQKLVEEEVQNGIILPRSDDDIATNIRSYILAVADGKLVGFCALHVHTSYLAEVRSLIVHKGYRDLKIGRVLVAKVLDEAKELCVQKVLALTYKDSFFQQLGFSEIPKESLPEHKIWADCIRCKHFPVCNEIALIKIL